MEFTTEHKYKLGSAVADLKTYLHDVENCISEHRMQYIDFDLLQSKLKDVLNLCTTRTESATESVAHQSRSHKKHK